MIDESLPEHFFVPNIIIGKTGKWKVSHEQDGLWLLDHTHSRNIGEKNDHISYFSFLGDKKTITAISEHEFGDDEHGTVGKFTSGGQPTICTNWPLFYNLEKPSFVNISIKTQSIENL